MGIYVLLTITENNSLSDDVSVPGISPFAQELPPLPAFFWVTEWRDNLLEGSSLPRCVLG